MGEGGAHNDPEGKEVEGEGEEDDEGLSEDPYFGELEAQQTNGGDGNDASEDGEGGMSDVHLPVILFDLDIASAGEERASACDCGFASQ